LYAAGAVAVPCGWLAHLSQLLLFAHWGAWTLVVANAVSLGIWTLAVFLLRRQLASLMYGLLAAELMLYAALAVAQVGWGYGVQYHLFALLLAGFLPPWPRWAHWAGATANGVLFAGLYYYAKLHAPSVVVPEAELLVANAVNIAVSFALSGAIILYVVTIADRAEAALQAEYAKSESLLENLLPTPIAARLKAGEVTIADRFEEASILFADLVGFTSLSQTVTPEELVRLLDSIFRRFDELVERYGLQKIKTLGDAYMVASGIPAPRPDHAEALASFALELLSTLDELNREQNTTLQLRIGMNSGPVVAGVIGTRRLLYDLWGDSVNTASRMESQGQPGKIQLTDATRQLLGDRFIVEERGVISVKGLGEMRTYLLTGVH
jgi:class 3 adenylate cyclase